MYLKSIEIQGFKSFANKTVLDFSEGITGIVGPNGSGKSNISDAVRWVLGEQKVKQLRGASMQDVIFAGTQQRRPQSYAYVAITLDNADHSLALDYPEVTVTRRLYRSGESEYVLNGTECRLKDINELFYDTGIGKEGYSIIGQGQIDKILSGRPEERRALFDEAVGIVKYKRRKDVAEKKLAEEQSNLTRVSDILAELERQVGPLRRQSEQAKEYLSLRERLLLLDANLYLRDMEAVTKELDSLGENESLVNEDLLRAREESEALRVQYDTIEERLRSLEQLLTEHRKGISRAELLRSNLSGQIDVQREQISSERNNAQHYTQRINALKKEQFDTIAGIEDNLSVLHSIREQISFIREQGSGEVEQENVELDLQLIDATLSETDSMVHACMGENYPLEARPLRKAEEGAAPRAVDGFLTGIEAKRQELSALSERLRSEAWELNQLRSALSALRQEENGLADKCRRSYQQADSAKNRLETLQNLAERYEGFGNAVKAIMDRRAQYPGMLGVVAELIEVPKDYETAIETALGGSIQNIVTRDENTAKALVEHLKKNRLGRATFLPLQNIRGRRDESCLRASHEKGVLGLGCDLVHCAEDYSLLAEHLLGRVLVVNTLENALQIARKYRQSLRIVTLDGELLNPGGAISGGAYRNSSNLMSRRRELEELERELQRFREESALLEAERKNAGSRAEALSAQLLRGEQALKELELEKNTRTLSIASKINVEYSSLSTRTDFVTENLHRLNSQLERVFRERSEMEDAQRNSDGLLREKEERIRELQQLIENAAAEAAQLQEEIVRQDQERESLLSERKAFFGKKDTLSERLLSMEKESLRVQNKREKLEQRIESLTAYLYDEYGLTYQAAKERYSEAFTDVTALRGEVSGLKGQIRALGSVNLDAIEQYREISGRYEFLNTQYQDLVCSEASLKKIIDDLDEGMRKQFQENFILIRKKFNEVFRVLFGGGQGRIELDTEDRDVLTTSISIIAEPPGKKLQNMMQLSGGEKALTAIALLFAIQSLKPSPFCLLDEIEAALDDSNVARFADYLRNLTERTQFIVITHRRGTMERADRLFGVTMQEKGISALVSVDLVQDQLEN